MKFVEFNAEHFQEYQSWFETSDLGDRLSIPDETWFNYLQCDEVTGLALVDDEGKLVAEVQIDRDPDGDGYFAICVKPEFQGRGIAAEAFHVLIKDNWVNGLNRLVAFVERDNGASKSLLENLGFHFQGMEDQDGFREYVYPLNAA